MRNDLRVNYKKIIKIANLIFSISLIVLLAHEIKSIRETVKSIVHFPQHLIPIFDLVGFIGRLHYIIDWICVGIIILCMLTRIILWIARKINTDRCNNAKGDNPFEISLLRYLNQKEYGKCYLITGHWGVGKSYLLKSFLDKYYKNTSRKTYTVSCFGLTKRKDVIEELSKIIEREDYSLHATIIATISLVPVVGGILGSLLKKNYGYGNVKENSIFIFEDFERLSVWKKRTRVIPKKDDVSDAIYTGLEKTDMDKYLAITGIINDIVEYKKSKVIIVCNTDIMGERFVSNLLREKLNCHEYRKSEVAESREQLAKRIADNFVIDNECKRNIIKNYVEHIDLITIQRSLGSINLRLFSNIIEAFIVTADVLEVQDLEVEGVMDSLLTSILVANKYQHESRLRELQVIPVGMTIQYFYHGEELKYKKPYKWIGYELAAYYIKNLLLPSNVPDIMGEWINYKYSDFEIACINGESNIFEKYIFNIFHLCMFINSASPHSEAGDAEWHKYFEEFLDRIDISEGSVLNDILKSLSDNLHVNSLDMHRFFFERLAKKSGNKYSRGHSRFEMLYDNYLEELTLSNHNNLVQDEDVVKK